MDPSQVEKTTMDRETMDPSEGETTKDFMSKAEEFMKNYFAKLTESCEKMAAEELAEKEFAEMQFAEKQFSAEVLANLYREDAVMNFDGENIQGKEAIRAKLKSKLKSLKMSRLQVLNIECLPVGGTDLSSTVYGMACGYIWLDGKQDARFFSQTFSLHPTPTPEGSFVISNSIFIHIGMESFGPGIGTALGSSARPFPFP